jgi:hypothetical protein
VKLRLVVLSLAISLLFTVPAFAEIVLFDDGPTDGFTNGFFIDGPNPGPFSQNISDGFVATASGSASSLDFGMWVPTGTTPSTVTWWLGTTAFGSDISTGVAAISQFTFHNDSGFGYDVYNVHIDGLSGNLTAGQTYWLSLGNANDSSGTQFDAWDVNGGPATCNFAVGGQNFGDCGAGGESFTLNGTVPEPGTFVMMGGGILAAAGALRRKIGF